MLEEYCRLRQEKDSFRRFYTDSALDLYVWYENDKITIIGFQLIYNKQDEDNMKAFTWEAKKGGLHSGVDIKGFYDPSPILVDNGPFEPMKLLDTFVKSAMNLDKTIYNLIYNVLKSYDKQNILRHPD